MVGLVHIPFVYYFSGGKYEMTPQYEVTCIANSLASDANWLDKVHTCVAFCVFCKFRAITLNYLSTQSSCDNLTDTQADAIVFSLWIRMGGKDVDTSPSYKNAKKAYEALFNQEQSPIAPHSSPTSEKETIMYDIAFETKTYVFGTDVTTMSEEQLIDSIKKVEKEIDNLKQVKTSSKKIESKIATLESMLTSIVTVLDNK